MNKRNPDAGLKKDGPSAENCDARIKMLDKKFIPPDIVRINNEMTQDTVILQDANVWTPSVARLILRRLQKKCQDIDQSMDMDDMYHESLGPIIKEAWEKGDYSRVTCIEKLRKSVRRGKKYRVSQTLEIAKEAWQVPFVGDHHDLLLQNIRNMNSQRADNRNKARNYMNHVSIIQSSGSGKSRLVNEVAKQTFTIPFNLREDVNNSGGGWPSPDISVRDTLLKLHGVSEPLLTCCLLSIFTAIFKRVKEELERGFQYPCDIPQSLASAWYQHLGTKRNTLYDDIANEAKSEIEKIKNEELRFNKMDDPSRERAHDIFTDEAEAKARSAFEILESRIRELIADPSGDEPLDPEHSRSASGDKSLTQNISPSSSGDIQAPLSIFMYFDEAHTLITQSTDTSSDMSQKNLLDSLISSLNTFQDLHFFVIFLSTQSKIEHFAPPMQYARSARYRNQVPKMYPSVTETPYDCFGNRPVGPNRLSLEHLHDIVFMSLFGRPLWRSTVYDFLDDVLDKVTVTISKNNTQAPVLRPIPFTTSTARQTRCEEMMDLARSKLLCDVDIEKKRNACTPGAQSAIIDLRLMLSFEVSRERTQKHIMDLVASNMRTVFSIPRDREFVRSGYPSEPILAEAAARQLDTWHKQEEGSPHPAVAILYDNLQHDLLSRGEIGEVTARLILMRARDQASLNEAPEGISPHFSKSVSVITFLSALFPSNQLNKILDNKPDNLPDPEDQPTSSLREAFKDAVINFTHFAKWGDDSATQQATALASFVRHCAPICRNGFQAVDCAIPVLLRRSDPLSPQAMTMILIQIKLRARTSNPSTFKISQEDVHLFPEKGVEDNDMRRPYISLVMDLGSTKSPSLFAHTPIKYDSKIAQQQRKASDNQSNKKRKLEHGSMIQVGQAPRLHRVPDVHPRYSIYVRGCSPSVYGVIKPGVETNWFKALIRASDLLSDHPRQDKSSLDAVRNLKPFFCIGRQYNHWIDLDAVNSPDEARIEEGDVIVVREDIENQRGEGFVTEDDV